MPLSTKQIAVSKITSNKSRSQFDNEKIEYAARSIIAAEGVINPLVVKRTGISSYELVDGDFIYHAAVRARELDLEKGGTIAAYIIEKENNESIFKEQLEIFRAENKNCKPDVNNYNSNLETRLTNLESRIESRFQELQEKHKELVSKDA